MPPQPYNPLGFWESVALANFHDSLLRVGGSRWDAWTPFNSDAPGVVDGRFRGEWLQLLEEEFGRAPLFVVKDPRICRLLPFWRRNLAESDIALAPILAVRNPFEVAQSLAVRNGFGMEHGLLLWLRHVLDAEHETRATKRSVVSYQHLLANWKCVVDKIAEETEVRWPERPGDVEREISAFLRPDLRHHVIETESTNVAAPLVEWVQQATGALEELSRNGSQAPQPLRTLDHIRRKFERAGRVFGPAYDEEVRADTLRTDDLEAARTQLYTYISARETELTRIAEHASAERSRLEQHAAALESERTRLEQNTSALEAERTRLAQYASALEAERPRLAQHASTLEAERIRLAQHVSGLEAERRRLAQYASALEAERTRLAQHTSTLESERTRLEQHTRNLEVEKNQISEHVVNMTETMDRHQARLIRLKKERDQLRRERDRLQTNLLHARAELVEHENHVRTMRASRSWRWTAPLRAAVAGVRGRPRVVPE
jgi:hypothetical protein